MYTTALLSLALAILSNLADAAFDPLSKNLVITYWGQGPNQGRLIETCANPAYDIINIGFVDVFPDQTMSGFPGTNFGNACWGDTYNSSTGVPTPLLKTCPYIEPDVIACQQTYGKKIFLSIGGGYPNSYYIKSNASGKKFADFLWSAFGPISATKRTVPRPWGNAVVDGFDFDTENLISPAPTKNYLTSGYVSMINHLKYDLFPTDASKPYWISGAPQCLLPDAHFTPIIRSAWFDFLYIQFYNTPQCSARAAINKAQGLGTDDISYSSWVQSVSLNKNVRMSIGVPGATAAAIDSAYYLTPAEMQTLAQRFYSEPLFGGVMVWEATYSQRNIVCTSDYGTWMKNILLAQSRGRILKTTCPRVQMAAPALQITAAKDVPVAWRA